MKCWDFPKLFWSSKILLKSFGNSWGIRTQQTFVDLQDVFKTTFSFLKTSLEDEMLLRWRRLQDIFKTSFQDTSLRQALKTSSKAKSRKIQEALIRTQ